VVVEPGCIVVVDVLAVAGGFTVVCEQAETNDRVAATRPGMRNFFMGGGVRG
jgi:hypothetical protein